MSTLLKIPIITMFSVKLGGYVIANAIVSKAEINHETD